MARIPVSEVGANMCAMLDVIAISELTSNQLRLSDDGYNVLYGSTAKRLSLFSGYAHHPAVFVPIPNNRKGLKSSAAGRYQILFHIWEALCTRLRVNDFEPVTQDRMTVSLIGEKKGAVEAIRMGRIADAITICKSTWASLPGANYEGQHMNSMSDLLAAYAHCRPFYDSPEPKPADFSNVSFGVESTADKVSP